MGLGMQFISRTITQKTQGPAIQSKRCKLLRKSENLVQKRKKDEEEAIYTDNKYKSKVLDSMFKNK